VVIDNERPSLWAPSPEVVRLVIRLIGWPTRIGIWLSRPSVRLATAEDVEPALRLEYRTFRALGYCDESDEGFVEDYVKYLPQSRFFVAEWRGRLVGVLRIISDSPLAPPVRIEFDSIPLDASVGELTKFEEVGICAVHPMFINTQLGHLLYQVAWRDAKERGGDPLGIRD